jgi:hypothetical protein
LKNAAHASESGRSSESGTNRLADAATTIVENYYRDLLPAARHGAAFPIQRDFEIKIKVLVQELSPQDTYLFLSHVDAARNAMAAEYEANPDALRRRLGISNHIAYAEPVVTVQGLPWGLILLLAAIFIFVMAMR